MSAAPAKIVSLRQLLAARFPAVPGAAGPRSGCGADPVLPTGIRAVDEGCGGLPLGALTEIVCAAPSCGSHLFLGQLLAETRNTRTRMALIDGTDSFDPSSFPRDMLAHLVWVRCPTTAVALGAADLLARDANLGLVFLDLRRTPARELRRTPATQWFRLQRAAETAGLALVVETPHATVPSARLRLLLEESQPVSALERERPLLTTHLTPTFQRQRIHAAATA